MNTNEAFAAYRTWHDTHAIDLRRALALYSTAAGWRVREYSDPGLRLQLQSEANALVEVHALTGGGWLVNGVETDDLIMTLTAIARHHERRCEMAWTYSAPVRQYAWITMVEGGETMIDVVQVVSLVMRKVPGAWRDLPGGRREQGAASYDVTFRYHSGATDRMTMCEESWLHVRALIRGEVTP